MNRKPSFSEALLPIIFILVLLSVGYGIFQLDLPVLLVLSAIFAGLLAKRLGWTWDEMMDGIRDKLNSAMPAIFILISIGALIGSWLVSGVIPLMIRYGLEFINPQFILVLAFIITLIVSVITGTSWGAAGSVGVALMGIAQGLDVSLAATAGAVVSGAYFGDKLSPLSDTTVLTALVTEVNIFEHIKHMLYTTIPAATLAMIVYIIVGLRSSEIRNISDGSVEQLISEFNSIFNWNILLLIPVIIVIYGAIRQKPVVPTMLFSTMTAGILAYIIQGFSVTSIMTAIGSGFDSSILQSKVDTSNLSEDLISLLSRGGLSSMMDLVLIILTAFSFVGIIVKIGCLDVVVEKIVTLSKKTGSLITSTVLSTIIVAAIGGSAYICSILIGEGFRKVYTDKNLHLKNLGRTIEDSGTVVIPLVPWSQGGVYMAGVLGVPVLSYLPWAVFCYSGFIFAIVLGYTGIGIQWLTKSEGN